MFCSMIIDGTSRSILQVEVEPDMQGRTFAAFNLVTNATLLLSYLLAGPVAERIFDPLLREDGALADGVGRVLGVGPGRGMALLLLVLGLVVVATAAVGYLSPGLRGLQRPADAKPAPVPDRSTPAGTPAEAEPEAADDARPADADPHEVRPDPVPVRR